MKRSFAALFVASVLLAACNAQQPPAGAVLATSAVTNPNAQSASPAKLAEVQKTLEERFKGAPIKGVRASVLPGLFEAMVGDDMIYFDDKLTHFIVGNLIEGATMVNLTEERTAELTAVDVKQFPVADAIKSVRGKGERVMYLFSDVDCPFCTRLEQTLESVDNVTIYTFMYPIDSLHPAARKKQKAIWCAKDRLAAWNDAVLRKKFDASAKTDCKNPVDATVELGQKLAVRATPSFFLADGRMVAGAIPKEQLEARLKAAQIKVAAR